MMAHPVGVTIGFGLTIGTTSPSPEASPPPPVTMTRSQGRSRSSPPSATVPSSVPTPSSWWRAHRGQRHGRRQLRGALRCRRQRRRDGLARPSGRRPRGRGMHDDRADDYDPAEHYDRVTAAWLLLMGDELHYGVFDDGDEPLETATAALTERMIEAAGLQQLTARRRPTTRVLDVGCGSGRPGLHARHRGSVSRSSASPRAPSVSPRLEPGRPTLGARRASASSSATAPTTASPTRRFDLVWVLESSHLMRDRPALISECARVLRPGGRVVLCDLDPSPRDPVHRGPGAPRRLRHAAHSLRRRPHGVAGVLRHGRGGERLDRGPRRRPDRQRPCRPSTAGGPTPTSTSSVTALIGAGRPGGLRPFVRHPRGLLARRHVRLRPHLGDQARVTASGQTLRQCGGRALP